jgi:protein-tyrosine phosphatase
MRILFVCLGNICRTPTAEGVMRHKLREAGLADDVDVESAGTGGWHVGHPPDERATATAAGRGIELSGAARRFEAADLDEFDLVLAMDRQNLEDMRALARHPGHGTRLGLLREYDPDAVAAGDLEVPDPYYGGDEGFEHVLDVVDRACEGLLREIEASRRTPSR